MPIWNWIIGIENAFKIGRKGQNAPKIIHPQALKLSFFSTFPVTILGLDAFFSF